ncbi:Metal homeostasis factor ATX1 [Madurella mycetomatis]|uniref:Metal homeostasis factor ATX1 n=1 Tax=Madurella mycetomatis TaxID=100816 RepID=A0A175WGX6_9PEZI|nr:Metal homeostasis factor ATX1 [Madurella mycetomatis]
MADVTAAVPAPAAAPVAEGEHKYLFNVSMSCGGCSGAVERVLKKLEGVKSYQVSLKDQTAEVIADESLPYEKVLRTIAKTGKKVNTGTADGVEQSVELPPVE